MFQMKSFFSPFIQIELSKEKQVHFLKIDFEKVEREHIFQVFGAFAIRQFSCTDV